MYQYLLTCSLVSVIPQVGRQNKTVDIDGTLHLDLKKKKKRPLWPFFALLAKPVLKEVLVRWLLLCLNHSTLPLWRHTGDIRPCAPHSNGAFTWTPGSELLSPSWIWLEWKNFQMSWSRSYTWLPPFECQATPALMLKNTHIEEIKLNQM